MQSNNVLCSHKEKYKERGLNLLRQQRTGSSGPLLAVISDMVDTSARVNCKNCGSMDGKERPKLHTRHRSVRARVQTYFYAIFRLITAISLFGLHPWLEL